MNIEYDIVNIDAVARQLVQTFSEKKVWAFHALMGAGKTTLIHAICNNLQVSDTVSSPAFAIINEYKTALGNAIYHMDWYRLKDEEEAMQAGVEDCILSGNMCFIEWPEQAPGLLPDDCLNIFIEVINSTKRKLFTT